jgi:hypothetical protein
VTYKPRVVTLPEGDDEFAADVQVALERIDGSTDSQEAVIASLLRLLQPVYPGVRFRQQHTLASFDSVPHTWYAYRDGMPARLE